MASSRIQQFTVRDWLLYLQTKGEPGDEFDLAQLLPGDELKIVTHHTDYLFTIVDGRNAILSCTREDRPRGHVRIMGCTFGHSSSIKPDHLFCGGNLEFTYQLAGRSMTHKTTAIRAIGWRRETPK